MMPDRKRVYGAITIAVVGVGVTAAGLYVQLSGRAASVPPPGDAPGAMRSPVPGVLTGPAARSAAPAIEVSAERLAQRLKERDGSAEDWALLARSYVQMKRFPEAVDAFARALDKMPDNAAFIAEQAAARKAAPGGATLR